MNYDNLTGLPSMTYFFKLADTARNRMHEDDIQSALVFFDINGIKYYNKKFGFSEGDVLIKGLAVILGKVFGEENCSRFGQDHFAAVAEADGLEEKLKKVFRDAKHINGGKTLPIRAGIYPDSMGLVEITLACDRAKYACDYKKDDGSSYYYYFDNKMLTAALNKQYIVDNIDRAISENWIKAFYQPIVRTTNRKVCDEEALARWIDPERGMLSPADFIPILEDTKLIYKVDLCIVDIILERMQKQKKKGINVVPVSVNLSRADFECCDIVEEINNRVEAAGISKKLLTIEITESIVGKNFDYMKEQINRFQSLGFRVWMDDFGSGYSALDMLQELQFDLIKFDMRFMRQFDSSPRSKIILTELMRMAQSLGTDTVCEGVETEEQADFLSDIGCTKLQGYFFCKPIPVEEIWRRYDEGIGMGFENPDEEEYHKAIGSINMYDLSSVSSDEAEVSGQYFDSMPMAVVEYDNDSVTMIRSNKAYRDYMTRYFDKGTLYGPETAGEIENNRGVEFINAIKSCSTVGQRTFIKDKMKDGTMVRAMIRKIIDNPVSGAAAYAVAVLDIRPESEQQLTYTNVARALSSDYIYLYYVNIETENFIEYSSEGGVNSLSAERHGENFFDVARRDSNVFLDADDRTPFLEAFTKENILRNIDEHGSFILTYRLLIEGEPAYVSMKIMRMSDDDSHIIIGVSNVDAQMRQQETIERLQEEQITYSRISVLMGDFIAIYTVDPETGSYQQYSASKDFSDLATSKGGNDFFGDSVKESRQVIHPDDLDYFMAEFSRERMLAKAKKGRVFELHYRIMINKEPVNICLRAGLVTEKDGPKLIVGICIDQDD